MANIITTLKARMIDARGTNKAFPCSTYASEANAEKAVSAAATNVTEHSNPGGAQADYVVFFIPEWNRWVAAINMSEVTRRKGAQGGYLGNEPNFFKW